MLFCIFALFLRLSFVRGGFNWVYSINYRLQFYYVWNSLISIWCTVIKISVCPVFLIQPNKLIKLD